MSQLLSAIAGRWNELLVQAERHKDDEFGKAAREAMRFYSEPHDFYYDEFDATGGEPGGEKKFRSTVNLGSNMVQVFLPVLYHRNPTRVVEPRKPQLSPQFLALYQQYQQMAGMQPASIQPGLPSFKEVQDQLRAELLSFYLNVTPNELNLKQESRQGIVEALLKGRGLLWSEIFDTGGIRMAGSSFGSVDDLLIDPDAPTLREARWIAKKCRRPVREVEQWLGLAPGLLRGSDYSATQLAEQRSNEDAQYDAQTSCTADLLEYYEIYSRIGVGSKLKSSGTPLPGDDQYLGFFDRFGDNVLLIVAPGVKFPLNLPESLETDPSPGIQDEIAQRLAWPIPLYRDTTHPWPCAALDFHYIPGKAWPQAHITPGMGFQKAIDWIFTYMMARIKITCRTFMVVPKDLEDDIKNEILSGKDLTLLEIESSNPGTLEKICQFIQMPNVATDIWTVLSQIQREFEKATGMTDLIYGITDRQMRSAQEANVKQQNLSVRPDDMASQVEDWMALAARNEAIAARLLDDPASIARVFGETYNPQGSPDGLGGWIPQVGPYTRLWFELVHTQDLDRILSECDYRIESGSSKKPSVDKLRGDVDESANIVLPQLTQTYMATGNPTAVNEWLAWYAQSRGLPRDKFQQPDLREQMAMQAQQAAAGSGGADPQQSIPIGAAA